MAPRDAAAGSMADTFGQMLFDAAMRGAVPLRDFPAGERHLRQSHPRLSLNDLVVGRGVAIGLLEEAARRPNARLVEALRETADVVERSLTHGRTGDAFKAALVRIGEVVDGALAAAAPP